MGDDKKLSWQARWELDRIAQALPKLEQEIQRLEGALDDTTGVVQPTKPYPLRDVLKMRREHYGTPENAKAAADEALVGSLPVKDENQAVVASNKRIFDWLIQIITNAGLPATVNVRKIRSRTKWTSVDSDWRQILGSYIPTSDNWSEIERAYRDWVRMCDEWRAKLDRDVRLAAQALRQKDKEISAEILRREMVQKYGLNGDCVLLAVIDVILDRDKYLMLAYHLERNRADWNDGPYWAENGLRRFEIQSSTDESIYRDIQHHVEDWQGDGRVFRDCEWNYTVLYEMADKALYGDLQTVRGHISED